MNLCSSEAARWLDRVRPLVADVRACDVFVLPAYTSIWLARERLAGSAITWGAQDVHPDEDGAHTGDVSAAMLADLGCTFVEVGHSERRRDHGESDDDVAAKAAAVVAHGMVPILCVGEPLPGVTVAAIEHVVGQVRLGLGRLAPTERRLVIAYEPVWAIGSGARPADPGHIGSVQRGIKAALGPRRGVRVIYGGSVDPSTAAAILAEDGVDGLFIGRAALDPAAFAEIVHLADRVARPRSAG